MCETISLTLDNYNLCWDFHLGLLSVLLPSGKYFASYNHIKGDNDWKSWFETLKLTIAMNFTTSEHAG